MTQAANPAARMKAPSYRGRPFTARTSGLRERAWWLMRRLGRFTLDDLHLTIANGTERDAAGNLGKYISALERVGVLQRQRRRIPGDTPTSNGHIVWRLVRDLGRQAPVWRSAQQVLFDPNSGELIAPLATQATDQP